MKKLFLLLLFLALSASANVATARETPVDTIELTIIEEEDADSSELLTEYDYLNPPQPLRRNWRWYGGHWAGMSLSYNGLIENLGHLGLPADAQWMKQSAGSIGVSLNFFDFTLLSSRGFGLITGLGLEINNFRFDNNVGITRNASGYIVPDWSYEQAGIDLKKSKLTTVYLNIPLLVEFQFGRFEGGARRRGFVNFGAVGGLRLNGHTKVKYEDQGFKGVDKSKDGLNLHNFHWGATFNIGYYGVALSATYYPQSIFISGEGPDVQQINIGLSFLF